MTTDVNLLPLPELHLRYGHFGEDALAYATDYARANMEPLIAENERLRGEAARLRRSLHEAVVHGNRQSGKAERLAEALRHTKEKLEQVAAIRGGHGTFAGTYLIVTEALDQEGGNG